MAAAQRSSRWTSFTGPKKDILNQTSMNKRHTSFMTDQKCSVFQTPRPLCHWPTGIASTGFCLTRHTIFFSLVIHFSSMESMTRGTCSPGVMHARFSFCLHQSQYQKCFHWLCSHTRTTFIQVVAGDANDLLLVRFGLLHFFSRLFL